MSSHRQVDPSAWNDNAAGLDSLIRASRRIRFVDKANPGWMLVASPPTDQHFGGDDLEIIVDSKDTSAVDELLERIQRVRNSETPAGA